MSRGVLIRCDALGVGFLAPLVVVRAPLLTFVGTDGGGWGTGDEPVAADGTAGTAAATPPATGPPEESGVPRPAPAGPGGTLGGGGALARMAGVITGVGAVEENWPDDRCAGAVGVADENAPDER